MSRGVPFRAVAAMLLLGLPLAWVAAAGGAHRPGRAPLANLAAAPAPSPNSGYLNALGNVVASHIVTVKPRVDGELTSVTFKEGDAVHQGQVLATVDARPYRIQAARAEAQLSMDMAQLAGLRGSVHRTEAEELVRLQSVLQTDTANADQAKLQLTYAQVTAPMAGVAGLRLVDPGNIVRAGERRLSLSRRFNRSPSYLIFRRILWARREPASLKTRR